MSDVIRRVHQLRLIKEGAEFVGVNVSNSSKTVTSDRVFWQPVVSWFLFSLSYLIVKVVRFILQIGGFCRLEGPFLLENRNHTC